MIRPGLLIALCCLAAPAAAAQGGDSAHGPPVRRTPSAPRVVAITYTDSAFDVPAELPAGITTFLAVNQGKELHQGTLVKLDSGKTMADLLVAMKTPGPLPAWAKMYGGPQNSGTVTLNLVTGDYVWVCMMRSADGVAHSAKGMMRTLKVLTRKVSAAAPSPNVTITMADYTFTLSKPITAGRRVLRVVTAAKSQPHELMIVRVPAGKTAADVLAWANQPGGPPPIETIEGIAPVESGVVDYSVVNFKPGRYVLICLVPDAKDGKSHASHGMVKEIVVR